MTDLAIVQISVGHARPLAPHANCTRFRDKEVTSGIVKHPVAAPIIWAGPHGLYGDHQADLRAHGGVTKAIYAYPSAHLTAWQQELGEEILPGMSFGENLTVTGADEAEVCIGDTFSCGRVQLVVTGPRRPCYKLARHRGDDVPRRMVETGRCGWYFRVQAGGDLPTSGGVLQLTDRPNPGHTVALVFADKMEEVGGAIPGPPDEE